MSHLLGQKEHKFVNCTPMGTPEINSTPKGPLASDFVENQTKPCEYLAAADRWLGSHLQSLEAGLWRWGEGSSVLETISTFVHF